MSFYALNVTPINGWATLNGYGVAELSLAVTGKSANVVMGSGVAALTLKSEGDGTRRAMAYAGAEQTLTAEGDGTRWATGHGDAAMEVFAEGEGIVTQVFGGGANMVMRITRARLGIMRYAEAAPAMELDIQADGRVATGRYGSAHPIMVLESTAKGRGVTPKRGKALAQQWINVLPGGRLITYNGAASAMALAVEADARTSRRLQGYGKVRMSLEAVRKQTARQYREIHGSGLASMGLALSARDLRIAILAEHYDPTPKARVMRLAYENRTMRVAAQRVPEVMEA